ncbi:MAG: hypothetical protein ACRDSH_25130, partial [Pseudonocardiaceae bacterium]
PVDAGTQGVVHMATVCPPDNLRLNGTVTGQPLPSQSMTLVATQAGLLAAELEARGFLAGVGKTILFVIVILVVIGGLIGFSVARKFGNRR